MINDLCAILVFSLGGAAAYWLGQGGWDDTMAAVVVYSFLHFTGSVFFVKSVFRERGNKRWIAYARVYHGLLLIVPWVAGDPGMIVPYIYSVIRTFIFAGKSMQPPKAGVLEIIGAAQFLMFSILWIQST